MAMEDVNLSTNYTESIGQRLFNCMKKSRNKIGQILADTGEQDTYGDILCRSIRTAIKLQSIDCGRGDVISTCSFNHKNSCVPTLASFFIGAIPTTFDPNLPTLDTIHLLNLMQPKVLFVCKDSLDWMEACLLKTNVVTHIVVFGENPKYSSFDEYMKESKEEESFSPVSVQDLQETAIVLFSSGTTGKPKGICLTHYTFLNPYLFQGLDEVLKGTRRVLNYATLYWITGVVLLVKSILIGDTRIICYKFDPHIFWNILEKYQVNLIFVPPYHLSDCLKCKPTEVDTSSLKLLLTGSVLVRKSLMEDVLAAFPHTTILNMYGLTEAGGIVTKFDPTIPEEIEMQRKKLQSTGKIQPCIQWKVVDPANGNILGPNQQGELLIKSNTFLNGYYKQESSSAFSAEGYLKTGDIFYYDEDYCFYFKERMKEMFKYRGWHILPSLLEEEIMRHPCIKEAVVIGVPHKEDENHTMAVVVLKEGSKASPAEIELFTNGQVSDVQKLRAGVKIIKEIPKTATGKIKRKTIRDMVLTKSI